MKKLSILLIGIVSFTYSTYITVPNTIYQGSYTIVDPKKLDQNFSSITSGLSAGTLDINLYRLYMNGILTLDQNRNLYLNNVTITGNLNVTGVQSLYVANIVTANIGYSNISSGVSTFNTISSPTLSTSLINPISGNIVIGTKGYIGINQINPSFNLDINGNENISGNLYCMGGQVTLNSIYSSIGSISSLNITGNNIFSLSSSNISITTTGNNRVSISRLFGQITTPSISLDQNVMATSDCMVVAIVNVGANQISSMYSDSSATPTSLVAQVQNQGGVAAQLTATFLVRKNDYFRIDASGSSLTKVTIFQIGQ